MHKHDSTTRPSNDSKTERAIADQTITNFIYNQTRYIQSIVASFIRIQRSLKFHKSQPES
jgi:hypothetical protein